MQSVLIIYGKRHHVTQPLQTYVTMTMTMTYQLYTISKLDLGIDESYIVNDLGIFHEGVTSQWI